MPQYASSVNLITSPHRCPFFMINDGFTRSPSIHLIYVHFHFVFEIFSFWHPPFLEPFSFHTLFNSHTFDLSMHGDNISPPFCIPLSPTSTLFGVALRLQRMKNSRLKSINTTVLSKSSGLLSWQCWNLSHDHDPFKLSNSLCNLIINLLTLFGQTLLDQDSNFKISWFDKNLMQPKPTQLSQLINWPKASSRPL